MASLDLAAEDGFCSFSDMVFKKQKHLEKATLGWVPGRVNDNRDILDLVLQVNPDLLI